MWFFLEGAYRLLVDVVTPIGIALFAAFVMGIAVGHLTARQP